MEHKCDDLIGCVISDALDTLGQDSAVTGIRRLSSIAVLQGVCAPSSWIGRTADPTRVTCARRPSTGHRPATSSPSSSGRALTPPPGVGIWRSERKCAAWRGSSSMVPPGTSMHAESSISRSSRVAPRHAPRGAASSKWPRRAGHRGGCHGFTGRLRGRGRKRRRVCRKQRNRPGSRGAQSIMRRERAIARALREGTPVSQVMAASYEHMLDRSQSKETSTSEVQRHIEPGEPRRHE